MLLKEFAFHNTKQTFLLISSQSPLNIFVYFPILFHSCDTSSRDFDSFLSQYFRHQKNPWSEVHFYFHLYCKSLKWKFKDQSYDIDICFIDLPAARVPREVRDKSTRKTKAGLIAFSNPNNTKIVKFKNVPACSRGKRSA